MIIHAGTTRRVRTLLLLAPLALAVSACSEDSDHDFGATDEARAAELAANPPVGLVFDPARGAAGLPFPIDLPFAGSQDGTLNITIVADGENPTAEENEAAANDLSDPRVALNLMDGYSTTAPITAGVGNALDPASVRLGETVRVFELEIDGPGPDANVTGLGRELGATDVAVVEQDGTLAILPLTPLAPATRHAVYLTTGLTAADGTPVTVPSTFAFVRGATPLGESDDTDRDAAIAAFNPGLVQLEPVRRVTRPLIDAITGEDGPENAPTVTEIALAWSFTTQGITEVLQAVEDLVVPTRLIVAPSGLTTAEAGGAGRADLFVGGLDVPYYQEPANGPEEFAAALNGFWVSANTGNVVTRYDAAPAKRSDETIPVLMSVPNASSGQERPAAGWPVMIFQHGITQNRSNMLAVADAMAAVGFVVVAIDIPMHGIVTDELPLAALRADAPDGNPFAERERTFGIDVVTQDGNTVTARMPDGVADASGTHFYNLANLVNTRDNLRQAAADLMTLSASLPGMLVVTDPATGPAPFPVDASRKAFLGHSLGGIVGGTFLAYDDSIASATLAMPGGSVAQVLGYSPVIGPSIVQGLAAANDGALSEADFRQFLALAQTLVDSGDPINHAGQVADSGASAVHLIEVVGEADVSLPDQTIPNAAVGAPLTGTEPLARELGLMPAAETTDGSALVRFSRGTHGSILSPAPRERFDEAGEAIAPTQDELDVGSAVTTEMQRQSAAFAASGGTMLPITDATVIAPVDVEIVPATLPELPESPSGETAVAAGSRP